MLGGSVIKKVEYTVKTSNMGIHLWPWLVVKKKKKKTDREKILNRLTSSWVTPTQKYFGLFSITVGIEARLTVSTKVQSVIFLHYNVKTPSVSSKMKKTTFEHDPQTWPEC